MGKDGRVMTAKEMDIDKVGGDVLELEREGELKMGKGDEAGEENSDT